jgi:splicing factor U2AF subunit
MGMGGGMMGMPGMMGGNADSSTKTLRELFIGNTPENTQEVVLSDFLNKALIQVGLTTGPGNPILQCRVSAKFAFIELRSIEETNAALNITGIPYMGNMLKVGRPSKYVGPNTQTSSWQQLTGQVPDPALGGIDPSTKVYRELFIGNTAEGMNEVELQEFLGAAMGQVGLTLKEGNPILSTRLSGKFAFVELRSIEEANAALNLNGIPYMGMNLRVGRPSKYNGPQVAHMEWNETLQKYLAGDMPKLGQVGAHAAPSANAPPPAMMQQVPASAPSFGVPTKVVKLGNMVTAADVASAEDHADIVEDTRDECGKFGQVLNVQIPREGAPGTGFVFVGFADTAQAAAAAAALSGRTFDGRRVEATYYDETKYAAGDFSA